MKLKDLIPKLQALNPEAEVYVWEHASYEPLSQVLSAYLAPDTVGADRVTAWPTRAATPSDTLIVLSE